MLTKLFLCLSLRRPPIVCAYLYSVLFRQLKPKKNNRGGWLRKFAFRFVFVHRGSYIITCRKYLNKEILLILLHLPKVLRKSFYSGNIPFNPILRESLLYLFTLKKITSTN